MNRPVVVAVRTTRRRGAATEVHEETAEDTSRVAWDEAVVDTGEAAAIVEKVPTTRLVRSVEVRGVVAAVVTPVVPEATAVDLATTVADTTAGRRLRITRWAVTKADTTKDLRRGSSSTHDNHQTRPR